MSCTSPPALGAGGDEISVLDRRSNRDETGRRRTTAERQGLAPEAVTRLLAGSFVAGPATNVRFMVKYSTKYGATGGCGFAQFTEGKPDGEAVHKTCFSCHEPGKDRDFKRYHGSLCCGA